MEKIIIIKKLHSGLRKFCYQKTEYVGYVFSQTSGELRCFQEMLQDCAGAVEGCVGLWAWERL